MSGDWGPFRDELGNLRSGAIPAQCRSDYSNRAEQWGIVTVTDYWHGNIAWDRPGSGPDFILSLSHGRVAALEVTTRVTKPTGYSAYVGDDLTSVEQYELPHYRVQGYAIVKHWSSWEAERANRLDLGRSVRDAAKAKIDSGQLEGGDWDERWLWVNLDDGGATRLRQRLCGIESVQIDRVTCRVVPGSGRSTFTTPDFSSLFDMPEVAYFDEVWLAGDRQYPKDGKAGGMLIVRLITREEAWEAFSTSRRYSFRYSFAPCEEHVWDCTDGYIQCAIR